MVKVGSRVKFLHSTGGGVVSSIKGNLANVNVDGFEIPALLSDIVEVAIEQENAAIVRLGAADRKPASRSSSPTGASSHAAKGKTGAVLYGKVTIDDDYEDFEPVDVIKMKTNYAAQIVREAQQAASQVDVVPRKAPWQMTDYSVKLAFVPSTRGIKAEVSDLDAYLVNDSSYELFCTVSIWRKGGYVELIKAEHMEADSKQLLCNFSRASLAQIQTLRIGLLPFKPITYTPQQVESFDIELHPLKFVRSGNFSENDFFDSPAMVLTLGVSEPQSLDVIDDAQDASAKKVVAAKPSGAATSTAQDAEVVDLHIEHIIQECEGLTPGEILNAQLARFTVVLDGAIKSNRKGKIVFIHGVGKGKLKYELKKLLDRKYSKLRYQDASFAEYGYGAIMVFL